MLDSLEFSKSQLVLLHRKIGDNVARIRKEKKITQLDLAYTIGYKSTSTIAKAEAGTEGRHFSIEQLYKISHALQVDIKEFFDGVSAS